MRCEYRVVDLDKNCVPKAPFGWNEQKVFATEAEAEDYLNKKKVAEDLMGDVNYGIVKVWTSKRK
jgi:hypothetical protein